MDFRLPIPNNWQDFESICHKLWSEIWNDPNAKKNGRNGQKQDGIDIYGQPLYSRSYSGVQCKDKDARLGSELKEDELRLECNNAINFQPPISAFTVATTAARDEKIQRTARELSQNNQIPFSVDVWSWEDISSEIIYRPLIANTYYPTFEPQIKNQNTLYINHFTTKDNLYAYFSRPFFHSFKIDSLKDMLIPLIYELSDNAYFHGKASNFEVSFQKNSFILKDNGQSFNPLKQLLPQPFSLEKNVGSFVFDLFKKTYEKEISIEYKSELIEYIPYNILEISLPNDLEVFKKTDYFEFNIDMIIASGRYAAQRLARSLEINDSYKEIIINLGQVYNISAFVEFITETLKHLNGNQSLIIYVPRNPILIQIAGYIKDERLKIHMR